LLKLSDYEPETRKTQKKPVCHTETRNKYRNCIRKLLLVVICMVASANDVILLPRFVCRLVCLWAKL